MDKDRYMQSLEATQAVKSTNDNLPPDRVAEWHKNDREWRGVMLRAGCMLIAAGLLLYGLIY